MTYLVNEHTEQNPRMEDLIARMRPAIDFLTLDQLVTHYVEKAILPYTREEVFLAYHAAKILNKYAT